MTDETVAFIKARLNEETSLAQAAGAGEWTTGTHPSDECRIEGDDLTIYDEGGHSPDQARHIALHDPARALRGIEAKRRIVDELERSLGLDPDDESVRASVAWLSWCVRQLDTEWSTHPEFQTEWSA